MLRLVVVPLVLSALAWGQAPPAAGKPADVRSTPRSSFFAYLEACRAGEYRRAASFLNIEQARIRPEEGPELARQLKEILDRKLTGDPGRLSNSPEGDLNDGLAPDYDLLGTVQLGGRSTDLQFERVSREGANVWLFAASTVRLVPALYASLGSTWAERHLPSWMLVRGPIETDVWQWMAMFLLALIAMVIALLIARIIVSALCPVFRRTRTPADDELLNSMRGPLRLLLALAIFQTALPQVGLPVLLRTYIIRITAALAWYGLAWLAVRIVDLISVELARRMERRQLATARSVLPLGRRTAKVAACMIAILATLSSWGYDTTAILAGLGVGGLAVALAAQKTIENLFGGVAITTDRPVMVGDFCKFGDKAGTVEDIGLRSTRLRTTDRTLLTIPNGQFSSMTIENFAVRDKILFNTKLPVTPYLRAGRLRNLLNALRGVLLNHRLVDSTGARVRLVGIGSASTDIEVFAYMKTANNDEFLAAQEELLLAMLDEVEKTQEVEQQQQIEKAQEVEKKQEAEKKQENV